MTPATITVNFIANFAGPHRICWRIQGSGNPYVCTNIVDCSGGGNTCQAVINTMVDGESCDPIVFEGYIQATCNAEGSGTGQVPFEVTYTPNPSCKGYILTNVTGSIKNFISSELGLNCDGTARIAASIRPNKTLYLCGIINMPQQIIDDFNVTLDSDICCSVCRTYTVVAEDPQEATIYYTSCDNKRLSTAEAPASGNPGIIICAVKDSISSNLGLVITDNGPC